MKTTVEKETTYDVLVNADGEVLFCLKARSFSPNSPQMLYNGEDKVLFYRRPEETILLDYVHPDARGALGKVSEVLIAEFVDPTAENPDKAVVREYNVALRHVNKLPMATIS
mgnify:FL=1